MIEPSDIGPDEDTARRVLVRARDIAPCIDDFPDGSEEYANAIAILRGVYAETPEPGSRRTKTLSRNGTSITFFDGAPSFSDEDVSSLRSLCEATAGGELVLGLPRGSFPTDDLFERLWPKERYFS